MIFSPVANFGHHPLLGHFGPVYLLQVSKNDVEAVKFHPQTFFNNFDKKSGDKI